MCDINKFGDIGARLNEPFHPDEIEWKPGATNKDERNPKCLAMAYIDARAVADRLDTVMGPDKWRDEYRMLPNGCVECKLSLKFGDEWVGKSDVGTQGDNAKDTDGFGTMTAYSHAFKRAASRWGIGRYLYGLPGVWVQFDPKRKKIVQFPPVPWWACPGGNGRPPVQAFVNKEPRGATPSPDAGDGYNQANPRQVGDGPAVEGGPEPDFNKKPAQGEPPARPQGGNNNTGGGKPPANKGGVKLPANGTELRARLDTCDANMARDGRSKPGELMAFLGDIYKGVKLPMEQWPVNMIQKAVEHIERFCRERPRNKK